MAVSQMRRSVLLFSWNEHTSWIFINIYLQGNVKVTHPIVRGPVLYASNLQKGRIDRNHAVIENTLLTCSN